MKKQAINYSWPAELFDFSQDSTQENFSRGRLRVFYKGETADHRYFSDAFAEEIVQSLPYTPIVSSYDEEKDDFVGHANEQQIFGIVDPCTAPIFETDEDGKEWCVCEVVLYTERPDKVGTLAQKIVGQPQSLELDPHSVEYVINYDEKKHFKNIEFTAGQFVGVSVLGKDQKPAFTGSAFFECNEDFTNKMEILRNYCERERDQSQQGGKEMNLQEFMSLSWGDIANHVASAISKEYNNDAYTYVVDMYPDYAIARFYYYVGGEEKLMKVSYTCDDQGKVVLGNINEVRVTYVDVEESAASQNDYSVDQAKEMSDEEKKKALVTGDEGKKTEPEPDPQPEGTVAVEPQPVPTENTPVEETPEDTSASAEDTTDNVVSEAESTPADTVDTVNTEVSSDTVDTTADDVVVDTVMTNSSNEDQQSSVQSDATTTTTDSAISNTPNQMEEVRVENEQNSKQEEATSSTSFTSSEREEFEALKREKRVNLVDSYKETLTEEEYSKFVNLAQDLDTSEDKLELELLRAYKRSEKQESKTIRAFSLNTNVEQKAESALDAFVRKNRK